MPSLDIIVTAYNNGEHLNDCLQSVFDQTFTDYNLLIIDNASIDQTPLIANYWTKKDYRFKFIRNHKNIGHIKSANLAYKKMSGDFVLQLHGDDILKPNFLQRVFLDGLSQNPNCSYGFSLYSRLKDGKDTNDIFQFIPNLSTGAHQIIDYLCFTNWIIQSFAIFNRQCFDRVGGFERHIQRFHSDDAQSPRGGFLDHYMWIRLSSLGPAYVVKERLGLYRQHTESLRNVQIGERRLIQEAIRTYDFIFDDHDLFDDITRYLSKVNQFGRLLTNHGLCKTALDFLNSAETGPEIYPIRKSFLKSLALSLSNFVFDDSSNTANFKLETLENIKLIKELNEKIPQDKLPVSSTYRNSN
ncbi:MAG: glycosyltransferase family 2 protein [Betaproteobacteria bacterium]|nr:glycosyltransferase family 2 protein [Betaproteobacteria bacterium]